MSDGLTEPFGSADYVEHALQGLGLLPPELQVEHLGSSTLADRITALLRYSATTELDDATLLVAQRLGRGLSQPGS
jgi:hypothetical protein